MIKWLRNPILALKFLEFSRLNLSNVHSFWTYNLLIRSLCREGYHELGKYVFDYMRMDGHSPDNSMLGFFVSSISESGKFDLARKLLSDVQFEDLSMVSFVINNLKSMVNLMSFSW